MDDSQPATAPVVHPEEEQQASEVPALDCASHPGDWSGHRPAETPVDTSSALIAASEAEGWAQRQTPTVTPADAVSILRAHADYIDPDGRSVPPADALTAATLRMAAQFLEDVAPEPLPRRQRLHSGLLRQLLLKAEAQQGALGPVDVQFVPAAAPVPEGATP